MFSKSTIIILQKILLVLTVLAIIYFGLGFLASIVFIVIEAFTHQISIDIGKEFSPWIIYVVIGILAIVFAGIVTGLCIGFYHLRKNIRKDPKV